MFITNSFVYGWNIPDIGVIIAHVRIETKNDNNSRLNSDTRRALK